MDNRNRESKKNKPGSLVAIVFIVIAAVVQMMDNIDGADVALIIGVAVCIGLLAAVIAIAKKKLAGAGEVKNPFTHSHDRLDKNSASVCTEDDHWKIQLDGFLKAGIIDKSEYHVLLDKHSQRSANYLP